MSWLDVMVSMGTGVASVVAVLLLVASADLTDRAGRWMRSAWARKKNARGSQRDQD
jgi:hypothetical protein